MGLEHYVGQAKGCARRAVALAAQGMAKCATDQLAKQTDIQNPRRKTSEEEAASAGQKG